MITAILYRCPACGAFDWLAGDRCTYCHVSVEIPSRTEVIIGGRREALAFWYDKVRAFDLPAAGVLLEGARVRLATEVADRTYRGYAGTWATFFSRRPIDEGRLDLLSDALVFNGRNGQRHLDFANLTSLTIESNTLIVVHRDHGVNFFDFLEESGKKWEDCTRAALECFHAPERIVEFFPRLRLGRDLRGAAAGARFHPRLRVPVRRTRPNEVNLLLPVLKIVTRALTHLLLPIEIKGREHVPAHGPALVLSNHVSFLDSLILGAVTRRNIRFMAKNSQLENPFLFWLLPKANAFPVRRYTQDVQAVRNAIRIIQDGHLLGIFPEGERSWDGRLLPFKHGTLRLALALGVPVIPVGVSGAYGLMPRWTRSIRRVPVRVRFGAPLALDHIPLPRQSADDIEGACRTLQSHIVGLMKEST